MKGIGRGRSTCSFGIRCGTPDGCVAAFGVRNGSGSRGHETRHAKGPGTARARGQTERSSAAILQSIPAHRSTDGIGPLEGGLVRLAVGNQDARSDVCDVFSSTRDRGNRRARPSRWPPGFGSGRVSQRPPRSYRRWGVPASQFGLRRAARTAGRSRCRCSCEQGEPPVPSI